MGKRLARCRSLFMFVVTRVWKRAATVCQYGRGSEQIKEKKLCFYDNTYRTNEKKNTRKRENRPAKLTSVTDACGGHGPGINMSVLLGGA
ncbi:hypothetical protein BFP46_11450 [Bacillus licheniformis]|nr:hypothetical protein BFP46_11450 [Bacillus licheniformis]